MSNYEGMTLEQIDAELAQLREKRHALKQELRAAVRQRDALAAVESARRKVEAFTPAEREALEQMVAPAGIESAEQMGRPGGLPRWLRRVLGS